MSIKLEEQDLSKLSPMMQHYLQTKKEYPGCILFYRLGDFYEMFFEDAEIVSKELELTLTGKSCGLPERAPMCGVPFHAVDSYHPLSPLVTINLLPMSNMFFSDSFSFSVKCV